MFLVILDREIDIDFVARSQIVDGPVGVDTLACMLIIDRGRVHLGRGGSRKNVITSGLENREASKGDRVA